MRSKTKFKQYHKRWSKFSAKGLKNRDLDENLLESSLVFFLLMTFTKISRDRKRDNNFAYVASHRIPKE